MRQFVELYSLLPSLLPPQSKVPNIFKLLITCKEVRIYKKDNTYCLQQQEQILQKSFMLSRATNVLFL